MASAIVIRPRRRHGIHIQDCCATSTCYKNFKDLDDRLFNLKGFAVFDLLHENCSDNMVSTMPDTEKYRQFLLDMMEFQLQRYFNDQEFVTDPEVNTHGHGKVYATWRVLDKYRARWGGSCLTRNVVDIIISVPEWNIQFKHHFCYRYFNRSRGHPTTLIPHILKRVVAVFYERYFTDQTMDNIQSRQHFLCTSCDHRVDEKPSENLKRTIPDWWYKCTYDDQNLPRVSS